MAISQKSKEKFELAKLLHSNKVPVNDIAKIVGRAKTTVAVWLRFDTYEQYVSYNERRNKPRTSKEETVKKAETTLDDILNQLVRIEQMLKDATIY